MSHPSGNSFLMADAPTDPPDTAPPFPDAQTCLQSWFDSLGNLNVASAPASWRIERRLAGFRELDQRTSATWAAGIRLPFFEAFENLGLDLLDRLVLLALLRDSFEPDSPGGLTRTQLSVAAGAAAFFQQEMLRERLERGTLRERGLVEDDGDRSLADRYYRLAPWARQPLLEGRTDFEAFRPSVPPAWPSPCSTSHKRTDDAENGLDCVEKITPKVRLSDVVLSPEARAQLTDVLAIPATVPFLRESWGLGEGLSASSGTALLFYGPPGTGKTLTAEAVAGELGKALLRLRVDQALSKWVGGTEKRLAAVFAAARQSGGVILLDEADSLVSARADSDARWEVSQVNVVLTEIERFPGVVILTTNRDGVLDPALERRLLARIEFALPGEAERTALWERHLPPRAPRSADVDLPALAKDYPLSGSFIRTAALHASVAAARRRGRSRLLTQADLALAASRQLARQHRTKRAMGFEPRQQPAPAPCLHERETPRRIAARERPAEKGAKA
jgi:AAA+ superfamily predicted ATPase